MFDDGGSPLFTAGHAVTIAWGTWLLAEPVSPFPQVSTRTGTTASTTDGSQTTISVCDAALLASCVMASQV